MRQNRLDGQLFTEVLAGREDRRRKIPRRVAGSSVWAAPLGNLERRQEVEVNAAQLAPMQEAADELLPSLNLGLASGVVARYPDGDVLSGRRLEGVRRGLRGVFVILHRPCGSVG